MAWRTYSDYEPRDVGNLDLFSQAKTPERPQCEYAREALKNGLRFTRLREGRTDGQ